MDILHTISRYQQIQLEKKGAVCTDSTIQASEDVLWHTVSPYQRGQLDKRGQIASGGGGGSYVAKAVQFIGGGGLIQLATSIADTMVCSGAIRINYNLPFLNWGGFTVASTVNGSNFGTLQGFEFYNFNHAATDITLVVNDTILGQLLSAHSATGLLSADTWFNIMWSLDTQNGIVNLYNGDTNVFQAYDDPQPTFPITIPMNGSDLEVGPDPRQFLDATFTLSLSDCWVSYSQFVDWSLQANRRKFIDGSGKPVSLGDGSTITGMVPDVYFSGDASLTGFQVNQGTAGAFTLTLPSGTSYINAPTSPSD